MIVMPDINELLAQNYAGFKRYTGIHKATFKAMLAALVVSVLSD